MERTTIITLEYFLALGICWSVARQSKRFFQLHHLLPEAPYGHFLSTFRKQALLLESGARQRKKLPEMEFGKLCIDVEGERGSMILVLNFIIIKCL